MKLVSLHNVSVSYEGIPALRNVTLDLFSDDFTGIIGPNGGGKTTLVKAVLGMVPYSGRIEFADGISIHDGTIGYLPQQNNFDRQFPISVAEVVYSGLQSRKRLGFPYLLRRTEKSRRTDGHGRHCTALQKTHRSDIRRRNAKSPTLSGTDFRPETAHSGRTDQFCR